MFAQHHRFEQGALALDVFSLTAASTSSRGVGRHRPPAGCGGLKGAEVVGGLEASWTCRPLHPLSAVAGLCPAVPRTRSPQPCPAPGEFL